MATPGLTIGPQNVDSAGELTKHLGVHNRADRLLKRHRELYPVDLTSALSRPPDLDRTASLDKDEVKGALGALRGRSAFFDPDKDEFIDATVRGTTDAQRIVSVLFRLPSGRTARGVIPYEGLTASARAHEERLEAQASGVGDRPAQAPSVAAAQRSQETELRAAEQRAREAEEAHKAVLERLERLENPEPFVGYDEYGASDLVARVKDGGREEFGRAGLERMRSYEDSKAKPRKSVLDAIDGLLAGD